MDNSAKTRILIVEDDEQHLELISRFLSPESGMLVDSADSLTEALEKISIILPDIIISDWKLPDGDGITLLHNQKISKKIPVILMTSHGNEKYAVEAMNAGAMDYIVKSTESFRNLPMRIVEILYRWNETSIEKEKNESLCIIINSFNKCGSMVLITDRNAKIIYANQTFLDYIGYSFDEIKGQNPSMFKSGYRTQDFYKRMWDTLLAGSQWSGELHNKKKNGGFYWEHATITPIIDADKNITHFIAIKYDITKQREYEQNLKKNEEKFRRIFENLHDVYFETLPDGKIIEISPSVESVFDIMSYEVLGKNILEFYYNAEDRKEILHILARDGHISNYVTKLVNTNKLYEVMVSATLIIDQAGHPIKIIGSIRDITKQKLEKESQIQIISIKQKLSALKSITYSSIEQLVHLQAQTALSLLEKLNPENNDERTKLNSILKCQKSIIEYIDSASGFNFFSMGANDVKLSEVNFLQFFNKIKEDGIASDINIPEDFPPHAKILIDENLLRGLILQLIEDKSNPQQEPTINFNLQFANENRKNYAGFVLDCTKTLTSTLDKLEKTSYSELITDTCGMKIAVIKEIVSIFNGELTFDKTPEGGCVLKAMFPVV